MPTDDSMTIAMGAVLNAINTGVSSKRVVLQASARVFDPLGLFAPFVVTAKVLFQKLWERGLGWDQQLPEDLAKIWKDWCKDIPSLRELWFPRCIAPSQTTSWELHIFCDASPRAYGACAYLRTEKDSEGVSANLIFAKSRVAPPEDDLFAAT
ncbi:hypothetical protein MTO96_041250 [Rhipicephalus appendiculatus]